MLSHNCLNYPSIFEDHAPDKGNDINCIFYYHHRKHLYNDGNTDNPRTIVATIDMANYNLDETESGSEINATATFVINNHTDVGAVGVYSIPVVVSGG